MDDILRGIGIFVAGCAWIWVCSFVIAHLIGAAMADPNWRF
jgi:hypothetical protein